MSKFTDKQILECKFLYESGEPIKTIIAKYGMTEQYIHKLKNRDGWERNKSKQYFEARKLVTKKEILSQFNKEQKQETDFLKKQAIKEGTQKAKAELATQTQADLLILKANKALELLLDKAIDGLEAMQGGKVINTEVKSFIDGKETIIKSDGVKMKEMEIILKAMEVMGMSKKVEAQVNIQNNNTIKEVTETRDIDLMWSELSDVAKESLRDKLMINVSDGQ